MKNLLPKLFSRPSAQDLSRVKSDSCRPTVLMQRKVKQQMWKPLAFASAGAASFVGFGDSSLLANVVGSAFFASALFYHMRYTYSPSWYAHHKTGVPDQAFTKRDRLKRFLKHAPIQSTAIICFFASGLPDMYASSLYAGSTSNPNLVPEHLQAAYWSTKIGLTGFNAAVFGTLYQKFKNHVLTSYVSASEDAPEHKKYIRVEDPYYVNPRLREKLPIENDDKLAYALDQESERRGQKAVFGYKYHNMGQKPAPAKQLEDTFDPLTDRRNDRKHLSQLKNRP